MEPTWVLSAPDGPHVGPMNLADRVVLERGPVSRVSPVISCCVQNAELLYEAAGSIVFHLCHIYLLYLSCRSPTMSCPYAVLLYTVMSSPVLSCIVLVPACPYLVPALPCPCPAPVTYYLFCPVLSLSRLFPILSLPCLAPAPLLSRIISALSCPVQYKEPSLPLVINCTLLLTFSLLQWPLTIMPLISDI